jgi:hypothetical protein
LEDATLLQKDAVFEPLRARKDFPRLSKEVEERAKQRVGRVVIPE